MKECKLIDREGGWVDGSASLFIQEVRVSKGLPAHIQRRRVGQKD